MSIPENGGGVRARVNGPATGLLVTGVLGIVLQAAALILNLSGIGMGAMQVNQQGAPLDPQMMAMFQGTAAIVAAVIGCVVGIVVIIGAMKMKNLESYGLAMTSSIVAMIPCISPCCLLGLPFGIWALVVLSDAHVKQAFRS